jgi:hypothetical protein
MAGFVWSEPYTSEPRNSKHKCGLVERMPCRRDLVLHCSKDSKALRKKPPHVTPIARRMHSGEADTAPRTKWTGYKLPC